MFCVVDYRLWSRITQRGVLQKRFQPSRFAGRCCLSCIIWDSVSLKPSLLILTPQQVITNSLSVNSPVNAGTRANMVLQKDNFLLSFALPNWDFRITLVLEATLFLIPTCLLNTNLSRHLRLVCIFVSAKC